MTAIALHTQADIVAARRHGRELAMALGLSTVDQTRLATAISELARNALQYGGGGVCHIEDHSDMRDLRIDIRVEDAGPGIAEIDLAMVDGFSTGGGLGAGLPGTRRLMSEFSIVSRPGNTVVRAALIRNRALVR